MKLVHKRRMINAMREFIINANDLTYEGCIDTRYFYKNKEISEDEFFKKAIDSIKNPDKYENTDLSKTEIYGKSNYNVSIKQGTQFCCCPENLDYQEIVINYNTDDLMNEEASISGFFKDMYQRSKITKGFANITLILLHELGHAETEEEIRKIFSFEDRKEADNHCYELIAEKYSLIDETNYNQALFEFNELYRQMPDEHAATDWAIHWLENADNRKIAKKFEKKFFSCFERA